MRRTSQIVDTFQKYHQPSRFTGRFVMQYARKSGVREDCKVSTSVPGEMEFPFNESHRKDGMARAHGSRIQGGGHDSAVGF